MLEIYFAKERRDKQKSQGWVKTVGKLSISRYDVSFQSQCVPVIREIDGKNYYLIEGKCNSGVLSVTYQFKILSNTTLKKNVILKDNYIGLHKVGTKNGIKIGLNIRVRQLLFKVQSNGLKHFSKTIQWDNGEGFFEFFEEYPNIIYDPSHHKSVKVRPYDEKRDKWSIEHPYSGGGFSSR